MEILSAKRYETNNRFLENTFTLVPLSPYIPYPSAQILGARKNFKIPLKRIDKLPIKFLHYQKYSPFNDQQLFQFNGGEITLIIAITYAQQSLKYIDN